jgi:hypothetical protein
MKPAMRSRPAAIPPLCLLLACGPAEASPRSLIDRTLNRTAVDLLWWDEGVVTYRDELGQVRREPVERFVAILPGPAAGRDGARVRPGEEDLAGGTPVVVELVDGQRLIGSVGPWNSSAIAVEPAGEGLGVLTPLFGARVLPLERVARILIDPWARPGDADWSPGVDDELILINGDRLRGFLVSFADEIRFDAGAGERPFPVRRVAEVRLGNPRETPSGPRVWWSSGAVVDARASGPSTGGQVRLTDGGETSGFPIDEIEAAWLTRGGLIPLASLPVRRSDPIAGRRWTPPVRSGSEGDAPLGTPHIALPGPIRVEWTIPPEAARFGAIARLGGTLEHPHAEPGRWGDAVVRVALRVGGEEGELLSVPLTRGAPEAMLGTPLPGAGTPDRTLIIEVLEGRFGPIHDRVLLDRPMLVGF